MRNSFCLLLLIATFSVFAQSPEVHIETKNGADDEKEVMVKLQELLNTYDLTKWIFTDKVIIERRVIPHSHPVLTISTRIDSQEDLLSTFIHEQLHWYVDANPESEKKAMAEFRKRYKNVPYKNRAGARDEYSTYMHLIVCYLEYRSVASLIGEEKSKQLMWNMMHYTWIYNKVIEDSEFIAKVLEDSNFNLLD